MKKILTVLLLFFNNGINAQMFGPDITVFDNPQFEMRSNFLDVGYNDRIYIGFNYHDSPFTGYRVMVSADYGSSWQTLIDFSVPGASGWYPQMTDMLVAGNDSSNLKVFLTLNGYGNGGPQSLGAIAAFDGITGADVGNPVTLGDFMTYGIVDVAICSDYRHALSTSNPYSVAVAYSVSNNSGLDSLSYYFSDDGGLNFTGPYEIDTDTAGNYGNVDIAFGSYQNPSVGKFGITFMKGNNLGVAFSDPGSPTSFSGIALLDTSNSYTSGRCSNPAIDMQSGEVMNSSADYTTVILSEVTNPTDSSQDIVSFYLLDTQNGGNWNLSVIDSTPNFTHQPSLVYDSLNETFMATYYDTTAGRLPWIIQPLTSPGSWGVYPSEYPDTMKFFSPLPRISPIYGVNYVTCSWKQLSDTSILSGPHQSLKLDRMWWSVYISEPHSNPNSFTIAPNPTTGNVRIIPGKEINNAKVYLINSLGEIVYSQSTTLFRGKSLSIPVISKGIYTIRVDSNGEINSGRVIIY